MAGLLHSPRVRPTILIETPQNPSPEVNLELQRHFTDDSRKIRVCLEGRLYQIIMFLESSISTFRARTNSLCIALPKCP
jgi:hypothetical protein